MMYVYVNIQYMFLYIGIVRCCVLLYEAKMNDDNYWSYPSFHSYFLAVIFAQCFGWYWYSWKVFGNDWKRLTFPKKFYMKGVPDHFINDVKPHFTALASNIIITLIIGQLIAWCNGKNNSFNNFYNYDANGNNINYNNNNNNIDYNNDQSTNYNPNYSSNGYNSNSNINTFNSAGNNNNSNNFNNYSDSQSSHQVHPLFLGTMIGLLNGLIEAREYGFARRPKKLFFINQGHALVQVCIITLVLTYL